MADFEVLRADEEWQRAGAYSVRIQGMNRQHHISLREEFDDKDGGGTRRRIGFESLVIKWCSLIVGVVPWISMKSLDIHGLVAKW